MYSLNPTSRDKGLRPPATADRQMRMAPLAVILFAAATLTGCINSGAFYAANLTNVELGEDNFRIVATNIHGQAEAG